MYSINVESPDEDKPDIDRSLSSNNVSELLPVVIEICRFAYKMVDPVALHMGDNVYRIFDIENPQRYSEVIIRKK